MTSKCWDDCTEGQRGKGKKQKTGHRSLLKGLFAAVLVLMSLIVLGFVYVNDYYHADAAAEACLQSSNGVVVSSLDGGWLFDGPGENEALIFYPGAKVECTAYAPLLFLLAERGVDCFLEEMPMNLAVFGLNRAEAVMGQYSYDRWYIGGHSLGGAIAASYASKHLDELEGIVLLGSFSTDSLEREGFSALSVYGSEDHVLELDKLEDGRQYMPDDYTEICIQGGNHAWFGSYGEQKGDGKASVSHEEQWSRTAEAVIDMVQRER